MISYEELYEEVKSILSEKRFIHSEGVVERALEYSKVFGADEDKIKLVAISHDIAKEIPKSEIIEYAESIGVKLDEIEKSNLTLAHAKIGAQICKEKNGFTEEMVNAVKYHTTGRENMSTFEKIIYLADATEKNRDYCDRDEVVQMVLNDIDEGMKFVLKWTIEDLIKKDKSIHLDTIKAYNFIINKK